MNGGVGRGSGNGEWLDDSWVKMGLRVWVPCEEIRSFFSIPWEL